MHTLKFTLTTLLFSFFISLKGLMASPLDTVVYKEDPNIIEGRSEFRSSHCTSSFGGDVEVHQLYDDSSPVGQIIFLKRSTERVKAKYFAHKQNGYSAIDRYTSWRKGRNVVLITSGAYGSGFNSYSDKPIGLTIDNGKVVNRSLEKDKDALVIVYATGGIAITNLEEGNLNVNTSKGRKSLDLRSYYDRSRFISWAEDMGATTFQTHLLIQNDQLKFHYNAKSSEAYRKILVLAKNRNGELYHILYNLREESYSLYDASEKILRHQHQMGMNVIWAVNTDTGLAYVLNSGGAAKDCSGDHVKGRSDRSSTTNALAYYWE